jgi:succinate dehydrogenase / fumarate reductase flavoprotein subunit
MKKPRVIVIGAGLAGLSAAGAAADGGADVVMMCRLPGGRSASACAQGGINAALNNYDDGDSPFEHFRDTVRAGAFLADQRAVLGLCNAAPEIISRLASLGVPFNRAETGKLAQR